MYPLARSLGPLGRGQGRSFSPVDVAGLKLWLKADAGLYQDSALSTPATANNDPVGGWVDQSTSGSNATQVTSTKRPLLKTGVKNGLPVVRPDGSDDFFSVVSTALLNTYSVFVVFSPSVVNVYQTLLAQGGTRALYIKSKRLDDYYTSTDHSSLTDMSAGAWYLAEFIVSAGSGSFFLNAVADGTYTSAANLTISRLGDDTNAPDILKSDIAEIVVYNSALSTVNRQSVEGYLNSKWAIY